MSLDEGGARKSSNLDLLAQGIRDGADPGLPGFSSGRRASSIRKTVGVVEGGGMAERIFDGANVAESVVRIGGG